MTSNIESYHEYPEMKSPTVQAIKLTVVSSDGTEKLSSRAVEPIDYAYYTSKGRKERSAQAHRLLGVIWRAVLNRLL